MPRRRPSFRSYAARRWRVLGALLVLLAGSILVLAITDRGHDPLWSTRPGEVDQAVVAPDGSMVYALLRDGENLTRLEARRGSDGHLVWASGLSGTRALLHASEDGVAVATDFPRAFLTFYGSDGTFRFPPIPLEGNPRAMTIEGSRLALALQAPGNPVLVFDGGALNRTLRFETFVDTLEMRRGHLAAGTGSGQLVVLAPDGNETLNASLPFSVRSLRMSSDASALVAGGSSVTPGNLTGAVAFFDLAKSDKPRWIEPTGFAVGYVDLDDPGVYAMAIESTLPRHTMRVFETATGAPRVVRELDGIVSRDDAGDAGGADLSPDGRLVVVATLRGGIEAISIPGNAVVWTYDSSGSSVVAFARRAPDLLIANGRLVPNGPVEGLFLFSASGEPVSGRLPLLAALLTVSAGLAGAVILGVGYWRVWRTY